VSSAFEVQCIGTNIFRFKYVLRKYGVCMRYRAAMTYRMPCL